MKIEELIKKLKKERNIGKISLMLLLVSLIFGISFTLFSNPEIEFVSFLRSVATWFIVIFIIMYIAAALINIIMAIISGKSDFYAALSSLVYTKLVFGIPMLISAIISRIPVNNVLITIKLIVFLLIILASSTLSLSILIRFLKELYDSDLLTVIVVLGIFSIVVILSWAVLIGLISMFYIKDLMQQTTSTGLI